MGMILEVSMKSPPTTRLSLLAKATLLPSLRECSVGPKPKKPTRALITKLLLEAEMDSKIPSLP